MATTTSMAGEDKRKHLEFIQNSIGRMGRNSFMLKFWTLLLAGIIVTLLPRDEGINYIITNSNFNIVILVSTIIVLSFWGLDGYFLQRERLFRSLYDHVRTLAEIDFSMDIRDFAVDEGNAWKDAVLSKTLVAFYSTFLVIFLLLAGLKSINF